MRSTILLSVASLVWAHHVFTIEVCEHEGICRATEDTSHISICASGYWQRIPSQAYTCWNGTQIPKLASAANQPMKSSSSHHTASAAQETAILDPVGDTAVSFTSASCSGSSTQSSDRFGKASYEAGGKMASVYEAYPTYAFRCFDNIAPELVPKYYVAFWTSFDSTQLSQPQPINCNQTIVVTNPQLQRSAKATVIDRCQSCVGVGRTQDDPTTSDSSVNGATIDLSMELWRYLFNDAPWTVYDIEYDGSHWLGSGTEPSKVSNCAAFEYFLPP